MYAAGKNVSLKKDKTHDDFSPFFGYSRRMAALREIVDKVAATDASILITGENGTGKSMLAKYIHHRSGRHNLPMVHADMGAITDTLFESEFFGHEKNAFTGASATRKGRFEIAHDSTLFLDEVANIPLPMQSKLLCALQEKRITRVGANRPIDVNVRLISATSSDPESLVERGLFRRDLLWRINTIHLHLPPLRERREDIIPLARIFISSFCDKYGRQELTLSHECHEILMSASFPGNIRQLEHLIEKAVILTEGDTITAVITKSGLRLTADAFVDVSGSSAMPLNCNKHGNGCAMCILRCHSFGPRVSVTTQSGVEEWTAEKPTGLGAMSGSCKLFKESLAPEIVTELEKTGCCVVPIPEAIKKHKEKLAMKACQQYALDAYADNIVLLDTGSAKLMTPYYPLEELRMIPGFERARFEDPLSGGKGNSMRYFNFAHVDASLKADGKTNLFCGGERAGAMVGHTEAIVSGSLAGHNAARAANGLTPVILPETTAIGEFIGYVVKQMLDAETRNKKYTFSGSVYFERMQAKNLYSTDDDAIKARVEAAGCTNIFSNL